MQVYSLDIDDFNEDNYTLIGIHTALEDFKLAYLLNKNLDTHFSKANYSLDFESHASFSVYNDINEEYGFELYLISNSYTEERTNASDTIVLATETKTYLIPEKKKVDYFIKIVGEPTQETIYKTVNQIKQINQVVTSYTVELDSLKSKQFLIF
ncbi:MAG: IPExxxVDY family protein [Flavobacteriaceae bacterium]|nr:IPExxxVDY family protein [Flavobacteriaceae bacterium]MDG1981021.1 IPExxxVDY family protein [Flavobacteriaceae bacterium]MDG2444926.1 IPExxxVDY family protein [Flavobacteriaceae bacterium]